MNPGSLLVFKSDSNNILRLILSTEYCICIYADIIFSESKIRLNYVFTVNAWTQIK
jgi:hypothetical protein